MFDSELQNLSDLYSRLSAELAGAGADNKPAGATAAVQRILRNQDLFARLGQMNSRLDELAAEWEKLSSRLDPAARKKTVQLACKVLEQAENLRALTETRSQEVEALRAKLGWELAKLNNGAKYLQSVKPLKANFPKFIDSCG